MLQPATRLVEIARQTVPSVPDQHVASHLQSTSQQLSTQLAELRVALNNAQQLNFEMQLAHTEDLIKELDNELIQIGRAAQNAQLTAVPGESAENATSKLMGAARQVSRYSVFTFYLIENLKLFTVHKFEIYHII